MTVVVTRAVGATAKPVGVLYVEPDLQVLDAGEGTALEASGLDPALTADLLSACLAHERCGLHLYRSVAARTAVDELRQQYERFGAETAEHVRILEELIASAGGDPHYVSPSARATEKAGAALLQSTYLLAGSIDVLTAEVAMVEAVLLAEEKDHGNWKLLAQLAGSMADGPVRQQVEEAVSVVLVQEEEHHGWASETRARLLFTAATGGAEPPSAAEVRGVGATDVSSMTKEELYSKAQELDIAGRGSMTKEELAEAVAEQSGGAR